MADGWLLFGLVGVAAGVATVVVAAVNFFLVGVMLSTDDEDNAVAGLDVSSVATVVQESRRSSKWL